MSAQIKEITAAHQLVKMAAKQYGLASKEYKNALATWTTLVSKHLQQRSVLHDGQ